MATTMGKISPSLAGRLWRHTGAPLVGRLGAWWYGTDYVGLVAPEPEPEPPPPAPVAVDETPVDRLALQQQIWGTSFLTPGGAGYALSLVKPMGVNPAMSLLDLTAGLGGPSRHISTTYDVYITGLERSAEIARRGHAMSVDAGLGRKVPITAYDPETVELRANGFDGIYAQYLTCFVGDKERLLREVMRGLKPRGKFSFVDLVLKDSNPDHPLLEKLRQYEPLPLAPWRVPQYIDCLTNAGFDCRIAEDQSDLFRSMVIAGWGAVLKTVNLRALPKNHAMALLEEAELWVHRLNAVEQGVLGVCRFYAISTHGSLI